MLLNFKGGAFLWLSKRVNLKGNPRETCASPPALLLPYIHTRAVKCQSEFSIVKTGPFQAHFLVSDLRSRDTGKTQYNGVTIVSERHGEKTDATL